MVRSTATAIATAATGSAAVVAFVLLVLTGDARARTTLPGTDHADPANGAINAINDISATGAVPVPISLPAPACTTWRAGGDGAVHDRPSDGSRLAGAAPCVGEEKAARADETAASSVRVDQTSTVPEPAPWLAMLGGLALLTVRRPRR